MERAIFLDRDNTLIRCDGDLGDPDAVELLDGVADGLRQLREAGYHLIVVTNQGGVARGNYQESDVDATHQRIATLVDEAAGTPRLIDRFYYCPYHPQAAVDSYRKDHPWRKPQPGMLIQAAEDLNIDLHKSWMIGDQTRDIDAGRAAGCQTILIQTQVTTQDQGVNQTTIVDTFTEAVDAVLQQPSKAKKAAPVAREPVVKLAKHQSETKSDEKPLSASPNEGSQFNTANPLDGMQRSMADLADELRAARLQRSELSAPQIVAGACQGLAILLAVLALLQLSDTGAFARTITFAGFFQLMAIAFLLFDWRR